MWEENLKWKHLGSGGDIQSEKAQCNKKPAPADREGRKYLNPLEKGRESWGGNRGSEEGRKTKVQQADAAGEGKTGDWGGKLKNHEKSSHRERQRPPKIGDVPERKESLRIVLTSGKTKAGNRSVPTVGPKKQRAEIISTLEHSGLGDSYRMRAIRNKRRGQRSV